MTKKVIPLLVCLFVVVWSASAQQMSWKKHEKTAHKLFEDAEYADAAYHYEQAWRQKTKKKELIHKAGEAYFIVKDYRKAADAFGRVKDEEKFPLAGLKYARCLKQDGQYESANREYIYFIDNYKGKDADIVNKIVQTEIKGCELGLKLGNRSNSDIELEHLSSSINTPEAEFAPLSFADDVLYYSSTMSDKARIYRSQRQDGVWSKAALPDNFPVIDGQHFCNGTLAPDGQRFYFTICQSVENWGTLTTRCEIYGIKRNGNVWSPPERLRDYINLQGTTATHPFVYHKDGKEYLLFSSNREGGVGGMDIWYSTRDITSDDIDFTFPENMGSSINTIGDDVTPFYNVTEETLYFSSNGLISLGGFDIFRATGAEKAWSKPENLKIPINSPADDFYYINNATGTGGFLVSNRLYGMEKITTQHEDIFSFTQVKNDLVAEGSIYEQGSGDKLTEILVSLYEVMEDGKERLLINKTATDGNYSFRILPNRQFKVEATSDGYMPADISFNTYDFANTTIFGEAIYLERADINTPETMGNPPVTTTVPTPTPNTTPPSTNNPEDYLEPEVVDNGNNNSNTTTNTTTPSNRPINQSPSAVSTTNRTTYTPPTSTTTTTPTTSTSPNRIVTTSTGTYTARGQGPKDKNEFTTSSPRHSGTYYKVQIIAVAKQDDSHRRYNGVRDLGRMDTEYIIKKRLTRVLLADFFSLEEAKTARAKARNNGFSGAYIIKYQDGERMGRI